MAVRRTVALLLALLMLVGFVPAATGQEDSPSEQAAKDGYDEAVAAEAEVLGAYQDSVARVADLDAQAATLDTQVAGARAHLATSQARLDQAQALAEAAQAHLEDVTRSLDAAQRRLEAQAVEAYIGGGGSNRLTMLLSVDDFDTLQSSLRYSQAVLDDQHTTVVERDRLRDDATATASALDEAGQRAVVARDLVQGQAAQLETARQALAGVQSEARAEVARQATYLAEVQRTKLEYQQRIAQLSADSDSITSMLQDIQSQQVLLTDPRGFFAKPMPVMVITSGFGLRVHPIFGDIRMHTGIDVEGATGDAIDAAAAGVVVWAGDRGGYGNCVIIDHGGRMATLYAHQSRIVVARGDAVVQGQKIGEIGSTGTSTGSHLHFEIRAFGTPTDPVPYLP